MTENEDTYWDPSYWDYDYGDESYYGFKGGRGKRSKGKGRGKKGGKFPFGKEYESFEHKGKPKGKGKNFGKTPKDGKANVAGAQPASQDASNPNATDGSTYNGSPYGNQTNSNGEDWWDEYYDSTTGHTWYTEDGVGWHKATTEARSFIATEIHSKKVSQSESSNEVYLAGIGRWQKIDCMKNATYVIIDSGCTRAMVAEFGLQPLSTHVATKVASFTSSTNHVTRSLALRTRNRVKCTNVW